jgi:hypothetical protein
LPGFDLARETREKTRKMEKDFARELHEFARIREGKRMNHSYWLSLHSR